MNKTEQARLESMGWKTFNQEEYLLNKYTTIYNNGDKVNKDKAGLKKLQKAENYIKKFGSKK